MRQRSISMTILRLTACFCIAGLMLILCPERAMAQAANSMINTGRALRVYRERGQAPASSNPVYDSGWSPKFGDLYDAYQQIKDLITPNKPSSGGKAPVGAEPSTNIGVEQVTGRVGSGVNRLTGGVSNFDRIMEGNSRFESETADLVIDRVPASVNLSSSITGHSTSGVVGGYVQDLTDRVDPNAVNNYTRNAGWTKTTDSWLRSRGTFGLTDETNEDKAGIKIYNKEGKWAYQKYVDEKIKNDWKYLNAKNKANRARGYSSKDAIDAYYRRTYGLNTKALEGGPCEKPNIYLYPTEATDVRVSLLIPSQITASDPLYPEGGWQVTAYPDGSLVTADGSEYEYLFYEAETPDYSFQYRQGFYLPAEEREATFRRILGLYGLNEKETADFCDYWGSRLAEGRDYYMYPQLNEACDGVTPLCLWPEPDRIHRLWFVFRSAEGQRSLPEEPVTEPFAREGYTVIEWGGIVQ